MQFQVLLGGGLGVWIGVWGGRLASLGDLEELDWGPGGAGLRSWGSRLGNECGFLNVYFREAWLSFFVQLLSLAFVK